MNVLPLLDEAERYLEQEDLDRAAELFARARAEDVTRSPVPLVGLARVAMLQRRWPEAKTVLDAVLAQHPRYAEALTFRGVAEEASGRLEDAMTFHARALAIDPALGVAHGNLGRCHAQQERWDLAAASLRLAVQHGAATVELKVQLGTALFRARQTQEALKVLALTVQAHPLHVDAIVTLADALVETGGLQLAFDLLTNASERLPRAPMLAARAAAIALRLSDLDAARREAWRHTELAPLDEEAWLFAAVVDTMQRRFDTAEQALRKVLALDPHQWRAHYHLGGLYDALRLEPAAKNAYRAAIRCEPRAWEPINNLAVMLLEEGTPDALREARKFLEQAIGLEATGDAVMAHYNLALACFRLGDVPATRRAALSLLKLAPPDHPMAVEAHRVLKVAA
jgi:tetratricopeptide (TPR) repeat protein